MMIFACTIQLLPNPPNDSLIHNWVCVGGGRDDKRNTTVLIKTYHVDNYGIMDCP